MCGLARTYRAPELHVISNIYYMTYTKRGAGTGLLRSGGGAAGPYNDLGLISDGGEDASLFMDTDGTVYWVWGCGWIARMKPDMTGLADTPRLPKLVSVSDFGDFPLVIGERGAFIFKNGGTYFLTGADYNGRMGVACDDTFLAWSTNGVYGPYIKRRLMVPHGGQITVFRSTPTKLWATFCGNDPLAVFRDRPAIVPLKKTADYYTKERFDYFTERGPWAHLIAIAPTDTITDAQVMYAPDSNYYMTGSVRSRPGGVSLWRSPDLTNWTDLGIVYAHQSTSQPQIYWGTEIHAINSNYYIVTRESGYKNIILLMYACSRLHSAAHKSLLYGRCSNVRVI